jgi:hypothetical protein
MGFVQFKKTKKQKNKKKTKKQKKQKKKKTRSLADSNSEGRTGLKAVVTSDEHLPMVAGQLVRSRCTTNQPIGGSKRWSGGCGVIP